MKEEKYFILYLLRILRYKWYVCHLDKKQQHEAGKRVKWLEAYTVLAEWLITTNNSRAGGSNVSGVLGHWPSQAHTHVHN